ncbi:probable F-box protein At4g22060 [Coffea arabica]|uniref:Probable F-box protein At4g22060 n=1 Tax=Coffea arabica TaxID=13443 RepID=A0A6P6XBD3_COFAR|nr:F-box protein SKIP23-like [Coffea arabica]
MADWSQLPYDIIQMIAIRLDAVEDFLAFSAVCSSWRSFYVTKKWTPGPQVPWLMLSDNKNSNMRSFFSLYRDKVYELELPEACGRRCWGSSDGWLVTIGSDLEIHLLNAFTRDQIRLPAASTFQFLFNVAVDWYQLIEKAILMRKPSQSTASKEDFLIVAIYGPLRQLAFTKPGYASWITVEESFQYRIMDVACLNDQIFAISATGTLLVVDINSHLPVIEHIAAPPHEWARDQIFLVESFGELLMIYQNVYVGNLNHTGDPVQFDVFKFDFGAREWTQLMDLGDRAIFLGDNISMSVSAANLINIRGNSIYFIGSKVEHWWRYDEHFVDRDSGVYNMASRIVEPFYFGADYPSYYSCPVWLTPTLCYNC